MARFSAVNPTNESHTKCSLMSIEIDANSRALHKAPLSILKSTSDKPGSINSWSRKEHDHSHIAFKGEMEKETPPRRYDSRGSAYHRDAAGERKVWAQGRRSNRTRIGRGMERVMSSVRKLIPEESEEQREAKRLLRQCRSSSLAGKIKKIEDVTQKAQPDTDDIVSQAITNAPILNASACISSATASGSLTPASRRSSLKSIFSTLSSRRSSASSVGSNSHLLAKIPLRVRKISLPLEYDPSFHPSQLGRDLELRPQNSISSVQAIFRAPIWTTPTLEDCTVCEIIRIVRTKTNDQSSDTSANQYPKATEEEEPATEVVRRLSDGQGNELYERVRATDETGRKKVLLQWGKDVDVIIPDSPRDDLDFNVGSTKDQIIHGLGRLCKKLRSTCQKLNIVDQDMFE